MLRVQRNWPPHGAGRAESLPAAENTGINHADSLPLRWSSAGIPAGVTRPRERCAEDCWGESQLQGRPFSQRWMWRVNPLSPDWRTVA